MIEINWDKIPKEYNWVAVHRNGELTAFDVEPKPLRYFWEAPNGNLRDLYIEVYNLSGIDWRETLTLRPGYSEKPNTHSGNRSEKPNS